MEEISWRQKSRVNWLKERDKNTLPFHNIANMKNSINSISRLKINEEWETNKTQIRNCNVEYFKVLSKPFPDRLDFEGIEFDGISMDQQRWFVRPFLVEEVMAALKSLEVDNALSPNGFLIKFLKKCWDVLESDAMVAIEAFYSNNQWCRSLSATFIALIPKKKPLRSKISI